MVHHLPSEKQQQIPKHPPRPPLTRDEEAIMLGKSSVTTERGVHTLKICGTPYEMGFQHGYLLAPQIYVMIHETLLALPAFLSQMTGQSFEASWEWARRGQKAAEGCWPRECLEELQGIVDGVHAAGGGSRGVMEPREELTLQDVILWNTYYDQWCLYCHPHYWKGAAANTMDSTTTMDSATSSTTMEKNRDNPPSPHVLGSAGGCSSFSAWNDHTVDGRLIMGKNEDNFNMPFQLQNRIMVVAAPSVGHGHVFMSYPGLIGLDGGMNTAGLEMMTQLNSMKDETMEGCGIAVFTRLLLTHVSTLQDAIDIFHKHPRCAGIAYHVVDAKRKEAAIIETSATHVCIRYPPLGQNVLWQANHSNCFPGWEGYPQDAYNMVQDQQLVNQLEDVSTLEKWQKSLRDPNNLYVQAPSRFERYRTLLLETSANKIITPGIAMEILSDCVDPYAKEKNYRDKDEPSVSNNILCTICALYPDMDFEIPYGRTTKTFHAKISNMWSMVAYPETGDFWLAIQDFPAQYGGYEYFNLHTLLQSMKE